MSRDGYCFGRQRVETTTLPSTFSNIWVFGVKPPNGTLGVSRFSKEKWSQFDP